MTRLVDDFSLELTLQACCMRAALATGDNETAFFEKLAALIVRQPSSSISSSSSYTEAPRSTILEQRLVPLVVCHSTAVNHHHLSSQLSKQSSSFQNTRSGSRDGSDASPHAPLYSSGMTTSARSVPLVYLAGPLSSTRNKTKVLHAYNGSVAPRMASFCGCLTYAIEATSTHLVLGSSSYPQPTCVAVVTASFTLEESTLRSPFALQCWCDTVIQEVLALHDAVCVVLELPVIGGRSSSGDDPLRMVRTVLATLEAAYMAFRRDPNPPPSSRTAMGEDTFSTTTTTTTSTLHPPTATAASKSFQSLLSVVLVASASLVVSLIEERLGDVLTQHGAGAAQSMSGASSHSDSAAAEVPYRLSASLFSLHRIGSHSSSSTRFRGKDLSVQKAERQWVKSASEQFSASFAELVGFFSESRNAAFAVWLYEAAATVPQFVLSRGAWTILRNTWRATFSLSDVSVMFRTLSSGFPETLKGVLQEQEMKDGSLPHDVGSPWSLNAAEFIVDEMFRLSSTADAILLELGGQKQQQPPHSLPPSSQWTLLFARCVKEAWHYQALSHDAARPTMTVPFPILTFGWLFGLLCEELPDEEDWSGDATAADTKDPPHPHNSKKEKDLPSPDPSSSSPRTAPPLKPNSFFCRVMGHSGWSAPTTMVVGHDEAAVTSNSSTTGSPPEWAIGLSYVSCRRLEAVAAAVLHRDTFSVHRRPSSSSSSSLSSPFPSDTLLSLFPSVATSFSAPRTRSMTTTILERILHPSISLQLLKEDLQNRADVIASNAARKRKRCEKNEQEQEEDRADARTASVSTASPSSLCSSSNVLPPLNFFDGQVPAVMRVLYVVTHHAVSHTQAARRWVPLLTLSRLCCHGDESVLLHALRQLRLGKLIVVDTQRMAARSLLTG